MGRAKRTGEDLLYGLEPSWEDIVVTDLDSEATELGARLAYEKRNPQTLRIDPGGKQLLNPATPFFLYQEKGEDGYEASVALTMNDQGEIECQTTVGNEQGVVSFLGSSLLGTIRAAENNPPEPLRNNEKVRQQVRELVQEALESTGQSDG